MKAQKVVFLLLEPCPEECASTWEDPVLKTFRVIVKIGGRIVEGCAVVWWDIKKAKPVVDVYLDKGCSSKHVDISDAVRISIPCSVTKEDLEELKRIL